MILERFEMRADPKWLAKVDAWAKAQKPPLKRVEAVRKLAARAFMRIENGAKNDADTSDGESRLGTL